MKHKTIIVAIAFSLAWGCSSHVHLNSQELAEIAGSWTGGEVLPYPRPDSQVVFFSVRPDSSLSLSMIFELGPRSRVWTYDVDVVYGDGEISWAYHQGHLNAARDTMWVSKDYRGDRSEWMWVRDRAADSLLNRLRALEPAPYSYRRPPETADGWKSANPEEVGLDPQVLSGLLSRVATGEFGDIHSILVVRNGLLAVEEYFAEDGTRHGPFIASVFRNRLHHLASVSKTVTSILVGTAIDEGLVGGVRDPLADYLPQYGSLFDEGKRTITLEHLLTMSPGLQWSQSRMVADHLQMWNAPDVGEYVLRKPLIHEPGSHFVYSNGAAVLVGKVLENATGMEVGTYAETKLFGPLGIQDYLWTTYPDGSVETDGGLALRPRDLAKIGQLVLNEGEWEGTQVVSGDWIRSSTQGRHRFAAVDGEPLDYGYFWIQTQVPYRRGTVQAFFHGGDGCQFLGVIPEWDMVVVFTAGLYGIDPNRFYHALLAEYLGTALH